MRSLPITQVEGCLGVLVLIYGEITFLKVCEASLVKNTVIYNYSSLFISNYFF